MNGLSEYLSDEELDYINEFLLERIADDIDTTGKDEGIFDIVTLDGFFTALVSGPEVVAPSRWLSTIWGDFEPEWDSEEEFETIFQLLVRHMNDIVVTLSQAPWMFEPLFYEREVDDATNTIVDEWCEGYRRGVELTNSEWMKGGRKITDLLAPIYAFTMASGWPGHECPESEYIQLRDAIKPNALEIHAFWQAQREDEFNSSHPVRREGRRIGRNEPCPCGSGKKYKKCCLH